MAADEIRPIFKVLREMSKPQVTITLGRSGQKVIKRQRHGASTDSEPLSGSKRYMSERFESNANSSTFFINKRCLSGSKRYMSERFESNANTSTSFINKRLRGNASTRSPGYDRVEGARVGRNDLRLKLTRKRLSRQIQHESEERKKMELRQKMSRTIRYPEGQEPILLRHIPTAKRAGGLLTMDPLRSYTSWSSDGLIPKSPDKVVQASSRISPPKNIDEVRRVPLRRPIDASRTGRLLANDVSDPSMPNSHATITMRGSLNAAKPVPELLPASGGMSRSSYLGEQPLSVSSLLHSLGLGKYAVQFQAEEVDMTVLKQMGDNDLKELGIPMGPRKKILLAMLPRPKRQHL